jgi:predicted small integral membrane protein
MADGEERTGTRLDRLLRLGTPPVAATVLTGTVALYMALVAFGNITDFDTNRQFVRHVLAMDTTFGDPDLMWRAIESPALQDAAYIAIIVWEVLTALVLLLATWLWIAGTRRGGPERARRASTLGLVMVLLLFGLGFVCIGGEWFAMWQSSDWNGLDAAARNVALAAFALVVVRLASPRGDGR